MCLNHIHVIYFLFLFLYAKKTHQFKNNFILFKGLTIHTLKNKHVFIKIGIMLLKT
jgi:hypothetical protein